MTRNLTRLLFAGLGLALLTLGGPAGRGAAVPEQPDAKNAGDIRKRLNQVKLGPS